MHILGFVAFLVAIGALMELARKRGEFDFKTTPREQRALNRRGLGMMLLLWVPVGITLCYLLYLANGSHHPSSRTIVYAMVVISAGVPSGVIAALLNGYLERFDRFRIHKSIPRKRTLWRR